MPTYNDLYWEGLGNPDLAPETSHQIALGNALKLNDFTIDLEGFYIASDNLIKWQPQNDGVWRPINIADSRNYGVEVATTYNKTIAEHHFGLSAQYTYVKAIDNQTKKQVIYVPEHLFNTTVSYAHKKWTAFYQFLFNGSVYTTTDHSQEIEPFDVSNLGMRYVVLDKASQKVSLGVKVNNLYNEIYQNVASRPMPNRNVNLNINYNF